MKHCSETNCKKRSYLIGNRCENHVTNIQKLAIERVSIKRFTRNKINQIIYD